MAQEFGSYDDEFGVEKVLDNIVYTMELGRVHRGSVVRSALLMLT